jgi:hypothetical protein
MASNLSSSIISLSLSFSRFCLSLEPKWSCLVRIALARNPLLKLSLPVYSTQNRSSAHSAGKVCRSIEESDVDSLLQMSKFEINLFDYRQELYEKQVCFEFLYCLFSSHSKQKKESSMRSLFSFYELIKNKSSKLFVETTFWRFQDDKFAVSFVLYFSLFSCHSLYRNQCLDSLCGHWRGTLSLSRFWIQITSRRLYFGWRLSRYRYSLFFSLNFSRLVQSALEHCQGGGDSDELRWLF